MKKFWLMIILSMMCLSVNAQTDKSVSSEGGSLTRVEGNFSRLDYKGFSMLIPSGSDVNLTDKEAIVKYTDGTYGMSVKVESDKDASASAAVQICRRLVNDLDVRGAKVSRVLIHGMSGGRLEGYVEGAPINVVVLDAGKKYLKLVIINTPNRSDWTNMTVDSVNRVQ